MSDYDKFFDGVEGYQIEARFYSSRSSFEVEDLYQAFKSRLKHELQEEIEGKLLEALGVDRDQ